MSVNPMFTQAKQNPLHFVPFMFKGYVIEAGFSSEDANKGILACVRINIKYFSTIIILHTFTS